MTGIRCVVAAPVIILLASITGGSGMTTQDQGQASGIRLQCCGGSPVPQVVVDCWRSFEGLPEAARDSIWDLFGQTVLDPDNPANERAAEQFCEQHGVEPAKVIEAVRACDYLVRNATALNLPQNIFEQDLALLSPGNPGAAAILTSRYESVKGNMRRLIVEDSLADHGKVLVGLDWRVDNVTASDRGAQLDSSVVFLTLRYRDSDSFERLTLQLTPESLKGLKGFVDRFSAG
jgi:hypothetical protein